MFGIGVRAILYFIAPILDNMLVKIRPRYIFIVFGILFVIWLSDVINSNFHPNIGHGITDYTSYNSTINASLFWGVFLFSFYVLSVIIYLWYLAQKVYAHISLLTSGWKTLAPPHISNKWDDYPPAKRQA